MSPTTDPGGTIGSKLYHIPGTLIITWEKILPTDHDLTYRGHVLYKCDDIVC